MDCNAVNLQIKETEKKIKETQRELALEQGQMDYLPKEKEEKENELKAEIQKIEEEYAAKKKEYEEKIQKIGNDFKTQNSTIQESIRELNDGIEKLNAEKNDLVNKKSDCDKKAKEKATANAAEAAKKAAATNRAAKNAANPQQTGYTGRTWEVPNITAKFRGKAPPGSGTAMPDGPLGKTGLLPKKGGRRSTRRKLQKKKIKSRRR
jgi:DNA repair exonuclease SbcCD ATPase subunit